MTHPNTLVFIDIPVDDVDAANTFYSEVFNWEVEERIPGVFHRIVPGGHYKNEDGSPSEIGNLHMGISNAANVRPHPDRSPQEPTFLKGDGRAIRVWILISEDDSFERIIEAARERGATILWENHFWTEFGGGSSSFLDPWGNQLNLWKHLDIERDEETHAASDDVKLPPGWTIE